jgi:hypothetical protein
MLLMMMMLLIIIITRGEFDFRLFTHHRSIYLSVYILDILVRLLTDERHHGWAWLTFCYSLYIHTPTELDAPAKKTMGRDA